MSNAGFRFETLRRLYANLRRVFGMGVLTLAAVIVAAGGAAAQEVDRRAARWEITAFPGGSLLFTESGSEEADFGDYALGAALTHHFNRYWGAEAEIGGGIGVKQRLNFADGRTLRNTSSPDMFAYQGNLILYPAGNDRMFAPYVAGGIGGLSVFSEPAVGFDEGATYLTSNLGTGAKVFLGRWGLRGDYRFIMVGANEDAPGFFGRNETRYGHRLSGGVLLNLWR